MFFLLNICQQHWFLNITKFLGTKCFSPDSFVRKKSSKLGSFWLKSLWCHFLKHYCWYKNCWAGFSFPFLSGKTSFRTICKCWILDFQNQKFYTVSNILYIWTLLSGLNGLQYFSSSLWINPQAIFLSPLWHLGT